VLGTVQQSGVTVVCPANGANAITDSLGSVHMSLMGAARPGPPGNQRARIYADGVLLGYVPVAMFDLDGGNGVRGSDLSIWAGDFISTASPARSDYDASGSVGGADLSIWSGVFLKGKSAASAASLGPVCP
jgi:hypothetical protein